MISRFVNFIVLLACLANISSVFADSEYGLIGCWKFDETSGMTAYDSSSYKNNGTLNGDPQWDATGYEGGCLHFDGTGDYVSLLNESYYDVSDCLTVMAWIKVDSLDENYSTILRKGTSFWLARNQTSNYMYFNTIGDNCSTSGYTRGSIDINDGQWHHIVGVFDGVKVKLYIDGVLDTSSVSPASGICQNDTELYIGSENAGSSRQWNGWIDNVKVYNIALSDRKIEKAFLGSDDPDLLGWWKFDETTGSTAYDSSSSANDGQVNGDPQWDSNGIEGGCLRLDGAGDYVYLPNESYYDVSDYLTVTAWIKADSLDENYSTILRKGTSFWLARNQTSDYMYFDARDSNCLNRYTRGLVDINDGQWHHVAGVFDGAEVRLYIDGIEDTYATASGTGICQNDTELYIGTENAGSSKQWNGWIDEIKIYARALSDEEIQKMVSHTVDPTLVGWWKFDEVSGSTAYDSSNNANNGTLNGDPQWDTNGLVGGSLHFDGTGDCVSLANESYYDISDCITVMAWIKVDSFDENYNTILRKGSSFWLARSQTSDNVYFTAEDDNCSTTSRYVRGSENINDGKWHHIVGVFDGSEVRLYIDGVEDAFATAPTDGICQNDSDLIIGNETTSSNKAWNGWIDDLRIYNRALGDDEISRISTGFVTEEDLLDAVSASDYQQYMIDISEQPEVNDIKNMTSLSRFDMWQAGVYASIYDVDSSKTDYAEAAAEFLIKFEEFKDQSDMVSQFSFAGHALCYTFTIVENTGYLTSAEKIDIKIAFSQVATDCAIYMESGGSMNRGASNLASIAWVKYLLPTDSNLTTWNGLISTAYDNDLMVIKDTNEDSFHYNGFWLSNLLEYTDIADKNSDFLNDVYIERVFERYRDQVSSIGVMPNYGDSWFNGDWGRWVAVFEKAGDYYDDGSYKWVAQKIFNLMKVIETPCNYESVFGLCQALRFMDVLLVPTEPEVGSIYQQERMTDQIPDKLVLRNGHDVNSSYLMVNLFNGGQHGNQDGSAVVSYINNASLLLSDSGYYAPMEYNHNLLMVSNTTDSWPRLNELFPESTWQYASFNLKQVWTTSGESMIDLSAIDVSDCSFRLDDIDDYNTTFDFYLDNIRLLESDGTSYAIDDFEDGIGSWAGSLSTDSKEGTYSLKNTVSFTNSTLSEVSWISLKNLPGDIGNYEKIEFWWKATDNNLSSVWPPLLCMSDTGDGIARWNMTETRSSRDSVVENLFDAKKAALSAIDVDIIDYLGGNLSQDRDIILAGDRFLWVRDFVTFEEQMSRQIGPLWQAMDIVQSGPSWYKIVGQFGSKDILLYLIPQTGLTVSSSKDSSLDTPWCVYQKASDTFSANDQVRFNSIIIPMEYTEDANSIVADISVIYDSDSGTAIDFGGRDGVVSVGAINNDSTTLIQSDKLDVMGSQVYLECRMPGTVLETKYLAASNCKKIVLGNQVILDSNNHIDLEVDYNLLTPTGLIKSVNASTVDIYTEVDLIAKIDGVLASGQSYNATDNVLTFEVTSNTSGILTLE